MQSAKQKVSDMASVAKEKVKIAEEKAAKATARSKLERDMAHEKAKAKEAEARMEMHWEKADHLQRRINHGVEILPTILQNHNCSQLFASINAGTGVIPSTAATTTAHPHPSLTTIPPAAPHNKYM